MSVVDCMGSPGQLLLLVCKEAASSVYCRCELVKCVIQGKVNGK